MTETKISDSETIGAAYDKQLASWRAQYAEKLAGPYGWWSITTLTWLEPGANILGSAHDARIPLAKRLPEEAVRFELVGDEVTITPLVEGVMIAGQAASGPVVTKEPIELRIDADPQPVLAKLIFRGELIGVRVYDPAAPAARDRDTEIAWFDTDQNWKVTAEFLAPEEGETIAVADITGQVKDVHVAGRARFEYDGGSYTLVATPAGVPGRLFFNFRDDTNRSQSYGGGRFLNVDGPVDGRIELDFNRAHHPPCAHSPYATCPTPTEENRLPFELLAGERYAAGQR